MALEHDFLMTSFYHYTTQDHLKDINESGVIKTVESNISSETEHTGPDVVWLFKDILQVVPRMLFTFLTIDNQSTSVMVPKCQIELTIGLDRDEVSRADKFMKRHNADPDWIKHLEKSGGQKLNKQYVIERNISVEEITAVRFREDLMAQRKPRYAD